MKLAGWGRYPVIDARGRSFETGDELAALLAAPGPVVPRGMGRSYGDSALAPDVLLTRRYDKFLEFDAEAGILRVESGVTLAQIVSAMLPRGWFLSVTPGTRDITVGGAIASDVHGKNHHQAGCFSSCVIDFDLMLADGQVISCSRGKNPDLFRAACGGMGLTGVILSAALRLSRVGSALIRETVLRCRDLSHVFEEFERRADAPYSVAWIDCLAKGGNIGRSVLMLGEHARAGRREIPKKHPITVPFDLPGFLLNRFSVALFNHLYYRRHPEHVEGRLVFLDTFFYPLDSIGAWNRMYGRRGFTQYQLVLPKEASLDGLRQILARVASAGLGSFLGVLKLFGPANDNPLSFPMEGYTLALDLKIQKRLFPFLDELDRIVLDHGGRLYLSKDVRMSAEMFRRGYPGWESFADLRERYGLRGKFSSLQSERLGV